MAALGTAQLLPVPTLLSATAYTVGQGVRYPATLLGTALSGSAPTVPTTGQLWPRGNP